VPRMKFITMCDTTHSLKSTYCMQEVLYLTCTARNFHLSILLPGRKIYFLGLVEETA
jgi:hypothetical protein